jgi:transcription initiation factor TFIIIB Brf1 subunit/transcription initiation factor TFIIB
MSDDFSRCPNCGKFEFDGYPCDKDGNRVEDYDSEFYFCKDCGTIIKNKDIITEHVEYH